MKTRLLLGLALVSGLLRSCRPSAHSHPSVTVSPSRSQFFEYKTVSLSCGPGDWTVWRYTTSGSEPVLSQCGDDWGTESSSTCRLETLKQPDSGVYWCESRCGDSSNAVNISITDGSVILDLDLPVGAGQDVTLRCRAKTAPPGLLLATFFKDTALIGAQPAGHLTLRNFSRSHEGVYSCVLGDHGESQGSWVLMEGEDPVSLNVSPSSTQLFEYDHLSFICGKNSSFQGWRVIRATVHSGPPVDRMILETCGTKWGTPTPSGCFLHTAKEPDSGIYWCESPSRQRSNSVKIRVYGLRTAVILQSPAVPVMERDNVTLICRTSAPNSAPAVFFKDGSRLREELTGHMTLNQVSRSDEGVYTCLISGRGESPPGRLFVRDPRGPIQSTTDPPQSVLTVMRHLVVLCPYCISTVLMVSLYLHRPDGGNPSVAMMMCPPGSDDERLGQPDADVTTEHHF